MFDPGSALSVAHSAVAAAQHQFHRRRWAAADIEIQWVQQRYCTDVHLSPEATDEDILRFVEAWIDDLAAGDYGAAFARIAHDPYYGWTPDLIARAIASYGFPDPHPRGPFAVTARAEARGRPHNREVDRDARRPVVARVWHDLPLNGEWSDLTATFRVEQSADGLEVILEEIHVF